MFLLQALQKTSSASICPLSHLLYSVNKNEDGQFEPHSARRLVLQLGERPDDEDENSNDNDNSDNCNNKNNNNDSNYYDYNNNDSNKIK